LQEVFLLFFSMLSSFSKPLVKGVEMSEATSVDPDTVLAQIEPAIEVLLEQRKTLIEKHLQDLDIINQKLQRLGFEPEVKRGRKPQER